MAVNYVALAATAKKLIEANGRKVTFIQDADNSVDVTKPWRARVTADDKIPTCKAVILDTSFFTTESASRGTQYALVAQDSLGSVNLLDYHKLIDSKDNGIWAIDNCLPLQPGETPLIYELRLKQ